VGTVVVRGNITNMWAWQCWETAASSSEGKAPYPRYAASPLEDDVLFPAQGRRLFEEQRATHFRTQNARTNRQTKRLALRAAAKTGNSYDTQRQPSAAPLKRARWGNTWPRNGVDRSVPKQPHFKKTPKKVPQPQKRAATWKHLRSAWCKPPRERWGDGVQPDDGRSCGRPVRFTDRGHRPCCWWFSVAQRSKKAIHPVDRVFPKQ